MGLCLENPKLRGGKNISLMRGQRLQAPPAAAESRKLGLHAEEKLDGVPKDQAEEPTSSASVPASPRNRKMGMWQQQSERT